VPVTNCYLFIIIEKLGEFSKLNGQMDKLILRFELESFLVGFKNILFEIKQSSWNKYLKQKAKAFRIY
jgi:hypothetical protein